MRKKFMREVAALGLTRSPGAGVGVAPVTEADLEPLPEAVKRYLRFMGVVGRPRDWSFRIDFTGRFRMKPDEIWMRCEACQYSSRLAVARIFYIRIRIGGIVPVLARDTYMEGRGRMRVRLLDHFTITDGTGEEFDIGELVTYLDDGVFIAPSMLLVPEVRWSHVDASSFDVELTDHGRTVRARVFVDQRGAPVDFSTTDRFYADPKASRPVRARWTTPVEGWLETGDRRLWTRGQAVWHLPEGEFAYADLAPVPGTLVFNVPPGE